MVAAITLATVLLVSVATVTVSDTEVGDPVVVYDQLWYRLTLLGVNLFFFIFFWRKAGQTIGMRAWRLKLIDATTGEPPSLQQCLLRCALAPVSIVVLGMGYWWCWFDREGRTIHDRLTKTRVIVLPKIKRR
jgi:uncharacterized RDD family membrane protein YckC